MKLVALALLGVTARVAASPAPQAEPYKNTNITDQNGLPTSEPVYPSPWMDPNADGWQEAYAKARDFVSQMTLLEKVNLTTGVGWQSERCVGNTGDLPRLGMRGLCLQDGPTGIRFSDYNSVFPSGVTIASTWDKELFYLRGYALGSEVKGKGVNILLGPAAGPLGRFPTGGRNWEGFSPDPYLTGIAFADTIKGVQDAGVIATAKHWVGNEQEAFRQAGEANGWGHNITESISSNIDDKTMHELYMWPFQDAVHAGVGAVMCSYNQLNNSYACQNSKLLNGLLKNDLGFQGFVMSDWAAQHTGAASAAAGLDMTMPGDVAFGSTTSYWGANLTLAVVNGTIPKWRIDDMAMRIMAAFFKTGQEVDQPDVNFSSWTRETIGPVHASVGERAQQVNFGVDVRGSHAALVREAASKGTVLLKNDGILPLSQPGFVGVFGLDAGPNPRGPNGCSDFGCNDGTLAIGWGSGTSNFPYLVTPDQALQRRSLDFGGRYESIFDNYAQSPIKTLAGQSNLTAIVFVNADSGEGYINVDDNQGDRKNLTLWANGDELIASVSALCPNTIVVVHSVGPVLLADHASNPNVSAILWAGLPGQESGNSIADVLYGDVNPAGRTPFTWAKSFEDYGVDVLRDQNNGNEAPQDDFSDGLYIDYRHFDKEGIEPVYEFGFGLSYTTFEYSDLKIERKQVADYVPTTGRSPEAPVTSGNDMSAAGDLSGYEYPEDFEPIERFVYPYINGSTAAEASGDPNYDTVSLPEGASDGSPRQLHPAGGAPGGNPMLWDVVYVVTATVTNTGALPGEEVAQLYLEHGGSDEPAAVLRGFDRLSVAPGGSVEFRAELTRRDISNWDVETQNWIVTGDEKKVYVGGSSRSLELKGVLA